MNILIADDEPLLRDVLTEFVDCLGHSATSVPDGNAALQAIHQDRYDIALLDIKMPGMSGLKVLESLTGKEDAPLVVMITADPTVDGAAKAVRDQAFEFLVKPVQMQQLADTLTRAHHVITLHRENREYRERLEQLVTERTTALRQTNAELEITCDRLATALESARRSSRLASLGELASGVAHEIRNPLSAISLATGNLQEEVKHNEVAQDCIGDIKRMVENLSRTVERILNFARPPKPCLQKGSLNNVIEHALTISQSYLNKKQIEVRTSFAPALPTTNIDEAQCEQILINLIINAVHAMNEKGMLTLRTWTEGKRICAAVADTGPGVPPDLRDKIFAPFHSGFETGTGLGLSISRSLAESHGGDLRVGDAPHGDGAQFILILPLIDAQSVCAPESAETL